MKTMQLNQESLEEARLPRAFWALGADTYFGSHLALKSVEKYIRQCDLALANGGVGLFLIGPPSSLKTFLLTFALKCLLAKGHSVRYTTLEEVTDLYFQRNEVSLESELSHDRFVAVDNLGEVINKAAPNALRRLLRRRSDDGLCTLLASDLLSDDFKRQYCAVQELIAGQCIEVPCSAKSFKVAAHFEEKKRALGFIEEAHAD